MGTILAFILAMALYPDIQTKIRMELDRVVGHGQLPTLDDRSRLPYVNVAIKETMRWNPVVPLSLPHFTSKEDVYQGSRNPLNRQASVESFLPRVPRAQGNNCFSEHLASVMQLM